MSESRVGELLRHSRSRHEVIVSRELRKASLDYRRQRKEANRANEDMRKLLSEMRYFEALDHRMAKGVNTKRKELSGVQTIRQRYLSDQRRKEKLEQLRQDQLRRNQALSNKVKEERNRRVEAVQRSRFKKEELADYYRSEKSRLMGERHSEYLMEMGKNRTRVETIVEFECNLRESYVRKKEKQNNRFIRLYRDAIDQDRRTVELKRIQTEEIKHKLKSLTEGTARKLEKMQELIGSIKKFKPSTPSHPIINKEKLMEKSRCYTETSSVYEKPNTHDDSIFISRQETDN